MCYLYKCIYVYVSYIVCVCLCVCLSVCVFVCSGSVCGCVRRRRNFRCSSYSPRCVHVGAVLCGVAPIAFAAISFCHDWPFVLASWTGALVQNPDMVQYALYENCPCIYLHMYMCSVSIISA